MQKIKLLALCGKAGSGKDTILNEIIRRCDSSVHKVVGCTTRPARQGEVDGVDYKFLTNDEFIEEILNGNMIEASVFNDWAYGTRLSELSDTQLNIGVFSPESAMALYENPQVNATIVYIVASDKVRLLRQLNRESEPDVKEIVRRFNADEIDFLQFDEYDFIVYNEKNGDYMKCACKILDQIK